MTKIKLQWLVSLILNLVVTFMIVIMTSGQTIGQELEGGNLVEAMISSDNCLMLPCSLNQLSEISSPASVALMLKDSHMADIESVEITENEIRWGWSSDTIQRLSYGNQKEYSIIDENFIRFDNAGDVLDYTLVIHITIEDMIAVFGDNFIIVPWTSHRILGAGYAIFYPQIQGYFLAYTDCQEHSLNNTTDVVTYTFVEPVIIEIREVNQFSIWNGYDTILPSCSALPRG